jgi:nucleotide-binding universal stress UspA family protein
MSTNRSFAGVNHILCPTDLSERSQRTLRYAVQLAEVSGAALTAFHSIGDNWLQGSVADMHQIERDVEDEILLCLDPENEPVDFSIIVGRAPDPAAEIIRSSRSMDVDLVVMKSRPGSLSALHFGSIVERVVSRAGCPVLLMPSRFLASHDPARHKLRFDRILFDYDFSQATDQLFHLANALTRKYDAELHVLAVLEPPKSNSLVLSSLGHSQGLLESSVHHRITSALRVEGLSPLDVPTTVEWGSHTDKVLKYASTHRIDLIATALPAPTYLFERIYRIYLGQLLASAQCPVLVKQCV